MRSREKKAGVVLRIESPGELNYKDISGKGLEVIGEAFRFKRRS